MRTDDLDTIVIVDFGSQTTQLIARRIREMGVYCEVVMWTQLTRVLTQSRLKGVILSGGPQSVAKEGAPDVPGQLWEANVPVLGICYGMQSMAMAFGGKVQQGVVREFGHAKVTCEQEAAWLQPLCGDTQQQASVWMSHGDHVSVCPSDFEVQAQTQALPIVAIKHQDKPFYGVQFHPEVTHTVGGGDFLRHFVCVVCGCDPRWQADEIIARMVEDIRRQVGQDEVILALSGGVDSSVLAVLLHQAIGKQLHCIFVDNGLLRTDEAKQVMHSLDDLGLSIQQVSAQSRFLEALSKVCDPEEKRRTIGRLFIDVFAEAARNLSQVKWLAQGTIYPDVIESAGAGAGAHKIKSHHNVGGLPEKLPLRLIEPLRNCFKDEVRLIGAELGLAQTILQRHPFPGPGLAVRIMGEIQPDKLAMVRQADHIFISALHAAGHYHAVSQAFCVLLPIETIGVVGDSRQVGYVIALRAVSTTDFMTAHCCRLPFDFLDAVATKIVNEVNGVARVVYDISGKPPATIEWE